MFSFDLGSTETLDATTRSSITSTSNTECKYASKVNKKIFGFLHKEYLSANDLTINSIIIHYDNNSICNFILNEIKPMIDAFCQRLSIPVLKMVAKVPYGTMEFLLQNIVTTRVRQMGVLRGIKLVANGKATNAFRRQI